MTCSPVPSADRRERLKPGRPVLRRDATTLQIGLDAAGVLLPDTPDVRRLLADLDPLGTPLPPEDAPLAPTGRYDALPVLEHARDALRAAGHLEEVHPPPRPATTTRDGFWAVTDTVALDIGDPSVRSAVERLVEQAGLRVDDTRPAARLVVSQGPLRREVVDDLVRTQTPHLLVSSLQGARRVGPFVVPGRTACLRCVDAHEAAGDPRRPLLIEQAARAARLRPEPSDPVTDAVALSWAVRDLACFVRGGEPATWSATLDLEPLAPGPGLRRWLRHPYCGCAWDQMMLLP
ncbi:hypothetical protein [Nocardioides sambongensis]|uniref:hypothetical protein n=1 Tax=Nocardioides sambongensis TaxID=2589074 RepID=UPI00112CF66A|nr:hypothetical protein [Nocardioides sambongensis]